MFDFVWLIVQCAIRYPPLGVEPPPGTAQVPSALKKLVVPPPLAGASPFNAEVNTSSKVVACVPVSSSVSPLAPEILPRKRSSLATFCIFAYVTTSVSTVHVAPLPETVISPLSPSDMPPDWSTVQVTVPVTLFIADTLSVPLHV